MPPGTRPKRNQNARVSPESKALVDMRIKLIDEQIAALKQEKAKIRELKRG